MQRAFIVTIDLPSTDPSSVANAALDIEADLEDTFTVLSVVPWGQAQAVDTGALGGVEQGLSQLGLGPDLSGLRPQ